MAIGLLFWLDDIKYGVYRVMTAFTGGTLAQMIATFISKTLNRRQKGLILVKDKNSEKSDT